MSDSKPAPKPELDAVEIRTYPLEIEEVRDAENGRSNDFTIKGHAAVFGKWSHDLGGFRERIAKGAFDRVLSEDPHVLHLIDHDTRYVLSSTRNKTLELRADPAGLHMWSKVAPTSYAADLRVLMERGDVDQSSFAFTVTRDKWEIRGEEGDEIVERTIEEVGQLFDVTTTAMGAYPQTDSQVASRTLARARELAQRTPDSHPAVTTSTAASTGNVTVTFTGKAGAGKESPSDGAGSQESAAAERAGEGADIRVLKLKAERAQREAKELRESLGFTED